MNGRIAVWDMDNVFLLFLVCIPEYRNLRLVFQYGQVSSLRANVSPSAIMNIESQIH